MSPGTSTTMSARSMPRAGDLVANGEMLAGDGVPCMPLRGLLDRAGQLLRELPTVLWVEAAVVSCKPNRSGHTLELAEAGAPAGQAATLRVFLPAATLARLADTAGGPVDPVLLVGMTTTLKVEPSWSPRYQLGARLVDLGREAFASLARQRVELLRATLRRQGLYDAQRRLPTPPDVTRVAVIHPVGAAGLADIAQELARWEAADLVAARFHAASFEGAAAPQALAAALRASVQPIRGDRPAVVLIVRGGGARAGLEILDDEIVVRAVAGCPVPVICGCGHAIDRGLVDEVAWRSCDTPSKAVARVARLIRTPALQAHADMQAIAGHVARHLAAAESAIADHRAAVARLATRHEMATRTSCAATWADLRVAVRGAEITCQRLATAAHRDVVAVTAAVTVALDGANRSSRDLLRSATATVRHRLNRADTGELAWQAVNHLAGARLDRAAADLASLREGVRASATARLDRAVDMLTVDDAVVAASSVEATLARGFALVVDPLGRAIQTVAGARAARAVTLHLHDGTVAADVRV